MEAKKQVKQDLGPQRHKRMPGVTSKYLRTQAAQRRADDSARSESSGESESGRPVAVTAMRSVGVGEGFWKGTLPGRSSWKKALQYAHAASSPRR